MARSRKVGAVKAKPTIYKGIQFRSRLEATWAAFFDNIAWRWEYEPAIFDGPGWLPDFLIGPSLLVEVKPVSDPGHWKGHSTVSYAQRRIDGDKAVLLLGTAPYRDRMIGATYDAFRIGDILIPTEKGWLHQGAFVTVERVSTGHEGDTMRVEELGVYSSFQMLEERSSVGKAKGFLVLALPTCEAAWAAAKNAIQWRPPA
jgi:hypothetical protein